MSIRSHPGPQQPRRKGTAVDTDRAGRCTERVRDIAEDIVIVADALIHRASDNTATAPELLHLVNTVTSLAQQATGGIVVRQRSQGKPLSDLAPELNLTEDRIRKKYDPQTIDRDLATRTRPLRASLNTTAATVPTTKDLLRQPRQRLACAMTRMWKQSRLPQSALARHMNIDASYVSRMLSGERDISLQHMNMIVDKCAGNLDLVKPLWAVATGLQTPADDPVRALRSYLRALHYAAGSPSDTRIVSSVQRTIIKAEVRQAFEGPGVPQWQVVRQLTIAFQSLPEITWPLWRKARSTVEPGDSTSTSTATSTFSAGAFG
ncbi:XRE family transcriptional regulator (plasmid) [Streptomyces poriferorum]|uniref:XRE family transcriptional regulator n=1 Tax=Streptomyces poriferorum TaxID=2798799 RepID=UPI00273FE7E6|nr:XRE family transcriptional regulator [Streptomyces sp. Alt1]WLQ53653.1 XRE family transcriptional regulator [Streptomyces sp. Alt1]